MEDIKKILDKVYELCPELTKMVIGKPITLHYLLKAIGKPYAISSKGHFLICPDSAEYYENTLVQWNLSIEDNLEPQLKNNNELVELLSDILLKK